MTRRVWVFSLLISVCGVGARLAAAPEPPQPKSLVVAPVLGEEHGQDRWAVVVGISKYRKPDQNLRFAADDARDFSRALVDRCGFQEDHIKLLLDEQATAAAIRSALGTWLPRVAGRDDLVMIYYSGHGSPDLDANVSEDGVRKYLVNYDADPDDLFGTAVPLDDLSSALLRLRSERTVVMIDSCYSGGALGGAGAALPRTFGRSNLDVGARIGGGYLDMLARSGRGRAVLTACSPNEKSFEYGDLKHGIFTHFLLEGLTGKAAGAEGGVTATGLYEYVYRKLKGGEEGRAPQTPMMATSVAGTLVLSDQMKKAGSGRGKLKIVSSPLGAEVFIDREPTPVKTPVERELSQGFHQLSLFKQGYLPLTEEAYVASDQTRLATFVLSVEERRGDLLVRAPAGSTVSVDSRTLGTVGPSGILRVPDLDAGIRKVRLEAVGFTALQREVTIRAGRPTVEQFNLQKAIAGLRSPGASDIPTGLAAEGDRFRWKADGAEMVFVSEGPFSQGRNEEDEARPRHEVSLPAFWIDRTEVTNAQYARFVQATGYQSTGGWTLPPADRAKRPATRVSLTDARAYAAWAGKVLPSEAQWEKAARGPDGRLFPYGTELNVLFNNIRAYGVKDAMDAGSLERGASPYGALDMLGNVWEWCDSPFEPYAGNAQILPGFGKGNQVLRGGSYITPALKENLTAATRAFLRPNLGQEDVGFRCVALVR